MWSKLLASLIALLVPIVSLAAEGDTGPTLGEFLPWWSVLPFAGLLLSIAFVPMVVPDWWHKNRNQLLVAVAWSAPVLVYLVYLWITDAHGLASSAMHSLEHAANEYVSFIALLGSLFIISGGILLKGDLRATPGVNTAFLAVGGVLANVIGTTGASMVLIRPMLRTNAEREHTWHIPVFFIFIVSNVGGALTPIGDPPLFLGYLRGIDFWWTLFALWDIWLPTLGVLLVMFYVLDRVQYHREDASHLSLDKALIEPMSIDGKRNFLLLAGVIVCVLFLSPVPETHDFRDYYAREIGMVLLTVASVWFTPNDYRKRNDFTYVPILEVAALFVGIFLAMIPATSLLQTHGDAMGVTEPWQYFWATGGLSAFLDNAPTYVTFAAMACGTAPECITADNLAPLSTGPFEPVLVAISLGAVFLGAGSYIGNGPNFMVRSIAERAGYKMPSFFGYCGYALIFLGPVYVAVTLIWLI